MNSYLIQANLKYLVVFLLAFCAVGCTTIPAGKFDVLAGSSQNILSGITETYTRIEKLQRSFAVEIAQDKPLTQDSFKPVIDGQSFDITPELHFREAALQVLVKYTLVLQSLAKRDFEGDVDRAALELSGSLKSLAATAAPNKEIAQQASGILATVVNVIGREIVRKERLDALKTVMDSAQGDIEKLAKLIVGSNGKIKDVVNIMLGRIVAHKNHMRPSISNPIERAKFDTEVSLIIADVEDINNAIDGLSTAIAKIPPAHAEIRNALDEKTTGLNALPQLVEEAQRIGQFYRNVK